MARQIYEGWLENLNMRNPLLIHYITRMADDTALGQSRPSPHQVQVMQDGKVLADWWPGKGTTMMDGKRGPKCKTAAQVVEWLQSA